MLKVNFCGNCLSKGYYIDWKNTGDWRGMLEEYDYPIKLGLKPMFYTSGTKYAKSSDFYDPTGFGSDFAPLEPVFESYMESIKDTPNYTEKLKLIELFFQTFLFGYISVKTVYVGPRDFSDLSDDTKPYFNLVEPKYREKFSEIFAVYESKSDGDMGEPKPKKQVVPLIYSIISYDDETQMASCRVVFDWSKYEAHLGRVHFPKNACVTARVMTELLSPFVNGINEFESFVPTHLKVTRVKFSGLPRFDDYGGYYLVHDYNGDIAIHPNISIAGTEGDFNLLDDILVALNIGINDEQRLVLTDDTLMMQQSAVMMHSLVSVGNGVDSCYDYGALMYLAWLASQDFYLTSWRGLTASKDWMRTVGMDNVADTLGRFDTYASVTAGDNTILITSAGFLRLTEGTIEKPVRVEWADLATVRMMWDVPDTATLFGSEDDYKAAFNERCTSKYAWRNSQDFEERKELVEATLVRLSYWYRVAVDLPVDEAHYRLRWTDFNYDERSWYRSNGVDFDKINFAYNDDCILKKGTNARSLSGTDMDYKDIKKIDSKYVQIIKELMNILHTLLEHPNATIYERPVGMKRGLSGAMWTKDTVVQSEMYVEIPKKPLDMNKKDK